MLPRADLHQDLMFCIELILVIVIVLVVSFFQPIAANIANTPNLLPERLFIFHFFFLAIGARTVLIMIEFEPLKTEIARVRFLAIW